MLVLTVVMCREGRVSGHDDSNHWSISKSQSFSGAGNLITGSRRETEEAIGLHSSAEMRSRRIVTSRLLWLHASKEDTNATVCFFFRP